MNAHHAEHLPGRLFDGNERHGAGVVDLRKSRDETVAEFLDRWDSNVIGNYHGVAPASLVHCIEHSDYRASRIHECGIC